MKGWERLMVTDIVIAVHVERGAGKTVHIDILSI